MKTDVEEISPVKKRIIVEIDSKDVIKKLNDAYRTLGKRAKIPGFRQGKIPRKVLENYFRGQVLDDVTRDLVKETLPKAVEETEIFPLTMPVVENEALKEGQNFKYSAVLEVKPQFQLKDYQGLEVEKEICNVVEEDVDKHLEEIRKSTGKLITVEEDRGIVEEDYAVIDYEGFEGDRLLDGIKSENFLVKVGQNDFHPDLEKALLGLKREDRTEVKVDFEENHHHAKLAGKSVDFKVRVSDIKMMELPELDDEFAKGLGDDFKDLNSLREKIREDLIKREETRIDRELKGRLLKKISDNVDFDLPESLVKTEVDYAIQNIRQNLSRSGTDLEKAGLNEEKLREEFRPASELRVKNKLILGEVARENELSINETELSEGFRETALNIGQEPDVIRKYYEANQLLESFRENLLEEKTLNYLVKDAKITDLDADKINPEKA